MRRDIHDDGILLEKRMDSLFNCGKKESCLYPCCTNYVTTSFFNNPTQPVEQTENFSPQPIHFTNFSIPLA